MGGAGALGVEVAANSGALAGFSTLFPSGLPPGTITALEQVSTAQGDFVLHAREGSLELSVLRLGANGALTRQSSVTIPTPEGAAPGASIDKVLALDVGGQQVLVTISGSGNFISTHLMTASGQLGPGMLHVVGRGVGYDLPSQLEAVQICGQTYVIIGATGSNSLSVFRLDASGKLTVTDHIIDELTTRFQSVTALETVTIGDRAFIFAGGADDGISVFTLLPDGRLLHLTSIADTNGMTLSDVSSIQAVVRDGKIMLFVGSSTETGLTQFVFDPGAIGTTALVGAGLQRGGTGGDLLVAQAGTTRLEGGAGNDILVAGPGAITLTGGTGADIFVMSRVTGRITITDYEHGVDRLDMSMLGMIRSIWQLSFVPTASGVIIVYGDTILEIFTRNGRSLSIADFSNAGLFPVAHYWMPELDPIRVDPNGTPSDMPEWRFGTSGNDTIVGNSRPELIMGYAGNDTISAGGGNDTVRAGDGNDVVRGGEGDDVIYGGTGRDTLFGDAGNDLIYGEDGSDVIYGGDGDDTLYGDGGDDLIYGGNGNDRLFGGNGNDTLSGEAGHDYLEALAGNNRLLGGDGNDTLVAGWGADYLAGGSGNDSLRGGGGNDTLLGEIGDDTLWGEDGADLLDGGAGDDVLDGGAGDDTLRGGLGRDRLYGGAGNDQLFGDDGDDTLWGGDGDDLLRGGAGNDVLYGGMGRDTLIGEDGNDTLFGETGDDDLYAGYGERPAFRRRRQRPAMGRGG